MASLSNHEIVLFGTSPLDRLRAGFHQWVASMRL